MAKLDKYQVAKKFWGKSKDYPAYEFIKERRIHELNYLVPKLKGCKTLLDLGCGDGALIKCLHHLTRIEQYYAYDYSEKLLSNLKGIKNVKTKIFDCNKGGRLPKTDVTIMAGVLNFMFDEVDLMFLLKSIKSHTIYIRVICTNDNTDFSINTYSESLKTNYSCIYHSLISCIDMFSFYFKINGVTRAYPDEIESRFGTKQYYFQCEKR